MIKIMKLKGCTKDAGVGLALETSSRGIIVAEVLDGDFIPDRWDFLGTAPIVVLFRRKCGVV